MQAFHGHLLIGGAVLRDLDGLLELDPTTDSPTHWTGLFFADSACKDCLQVGRPYRLMLADGRAGQLIVSEVDDIEQARRLVVKFRGTSDLS